MSQPDIRTEFRAIFDEIGTSFGFAEPEEYLRKAGVVDRLNGLLDSMKMYNLDLGYSGAMGGFSKEVDIAYDMRESLFGISQPPRGEYNQRYSFAPNSDEFKQAQARLRQRELLARQRELTAELHDVEAELHA